MADRAAPPLGGVDELVRYFEGGAKPAAEARVGMEHEKIAVLGSGPGLGRAPDYALIRRLLEAVAAQGWTVASEDGQPIALSRPGSGTLTLEPGGQVEHSGAPWPSAAEAARDNDRHIDELLPLAGELGLVFIGVGFRPFGTLDEVPWMPKGRYRVMREYLPTRGRLAHEMMKRTATVQANLDFVDEADAMRKLRLGLGLSSLVTALFAASPLVEGRPSGYQSYRARAWLETDPDRCGLLPFVFDERASFADYVSWALGVPLFFIYRHGEYLPVHIPFGQFLKEGVDGERATLADWELHLSTLFPEARLKRYVEVRQADASTREMVRALPALWRGLLYDAASAEAAWQLVAGWSMDERQALYRATPKEGLRARVRDQPILGLCRELVNIARAGLGRLGGDGVSLLAPLEEVVSEARTVADRVVAAHEETGGDPARLIAALKLR